ncbi:MAG: response regulator [Chlorobium sp.]|nr:response regulator [Chlorobium sp.]
MMRGIILDDEKNIVEMLKVLIDWKGLGIDLVGEAYDGKRGLELVDRTDPDFVISDINMPALNGIDFAQAAIAKHPDIKIIFLTGYNDFEYARRAINIGAFRFLLKPVDENELRSAMMKMIYDKEKHGDTLRSEDQLLTRRGEDDSKRSFLNGLIEGRNDLFLLNKKSELSGLEFLLEESRQRLFLFTPDQLVRTHENRPDYQKNLSLIIDSVEKSFSRIRKKVCFEYRGEVCLLATEDDETIGLHVNPKIICDKIRHELLVIEGLSISIGCSKPYSGPKHVITGYGEAKQALSYTFIFGENRTIYFSDIEELESKHIAISENSRLEIARLLRQGNTEQLAVIVETYFSEASNKQRSAYSTKILCLEFGMVGVAFLVEKEIRPRDISGVDENPLEIIKEKRTILEAKGWIIDYFAKLATLALEVGAKQQSSFVGVAVKVINENLSDQSLSAHSIAKGLGINQDYLSALFKQEFNIPLAKYINIYRLNTAKDLLDRDWKNISAVSKKVGFSEQNYFSKCFKKHFGVSPSEYIAQKND